MAIGLRTYIWNNNIWSVLLLLLYPILMAAIVWGAAFAGYLAFYGGMTYHTTGTLNFVQAAALANGFIVLNWYYILGVVLLWFLIAFCLHERMIRAMAGARPVTRLEEPELYNLLENLCISRGIPVPKLNIIETHARNAFASGIDEKSYTITVTRGLLQSLTKDEVEAVLGHELTHIINNDVRLLIISIIFVGMVGFAAQFSGRFVRAMSRGSRGSRKGGGGMIILIALAIMLVLWIGYAATLLTRFALSRRREYLADAGAIELTKKPEAMMTALQRIAGRDAIPNVPADIKLMCLENGKSFMGIFATHPPIEARIRQIAAMNNVPIPAETSLPPAGNETSMGVAAGPPVKPEKKRRNPWRTV
jgi:heat shock protein HtpX